MMMGDDVCELTMNPGGHANIVSTTIVGFEYVLGGASEVFDAEVAGADEREDFVGLTMDFFVKEVGDSVVLTALGFVEDALGFWRIVTKGFLNGGALATMIGLDAHDVGEVDFFDFAVGTGEDDSVEVEVVGDGVFVFSNCFYIFICKANPQSVGYYD
jgi:hypothetical protein